MNRPLAQVLLVVALLMLAFFQLHLYQYLTLDYLQQHQQWMVQAERQSPLQTRRLFFSLYVAATTLSLPGTLLLSLRLLTSITLYVNAGRQLAQLHSLSDLNSPALLASLMVLAALPLGALAVRHALKPSGAKAERSENMEQ
jgi:hypothetical protein